MLLLDWFSVYNFQIICFFKQLKKYYELEFASNTLIIFRIIRYNIMACLRHKCLQFRQNRFFAWINFYHHSGSKDCCSPNGTFVCTVNLWWYINWICCNNSNFYFYLLSITISILQGIAKMAKTFYTGNSKIVIRSTYFLVYGWFCLFLYFYWLQYFNPCIPAEHT